MVKKYFSYDPLDNEFDTHDSIEDAIKCANLYLDYYKEEACNNGWDDSVTNIAYGEITGSAYQYLKHIKNDFTEEEWNDLGYSNNFEIIVDYELSEPKIRSEKEIRNNFEDWYESINGFGSLERLPNGNYAYQIPQTAWEAYKQAYVDMEK